MAQYTSPQIFIMVSSIYLLLLTNLYFILISYLICWYHLTAFLMVTVILDLAFLLSICNEGQLVSDAVSQPD